MGSMLTSSAGEQGALLLAGAFRPAGVRELTSGRSTLCLRQVAVRQYRMDGDVRQ